MSDLLALLRQAGLNEYESKAYGVLLELDSASAADVSKRAGIPRARVYDVLVGLEKKGFLAQEPCRPVRFRAFHPETALSNLEKSKRKGLEAELFLLAELKAVLAKRADSMEKNRSESSETAFLVVGSQNIESKIEELVKTASKEALICTNEANLSRKTALLQRILGKSDSKIPVSFCVSAKADVSVLPVKNKQLSEFSNVSFIQSGNPARFMVFDGKKSLLFLSHEKKEDEKALLIDSESVARFLKETIKQKQTEN